MSFAMLTLGIETSGRTGSIAILRDGVRVVSRELEAAGRRHAQTLVAEIKAAFDEFGLRLADCGFVAVSIGPGSFTGLRVGVVCAKTLAYAVGCRLTAVDTFEAVAAQSPDDVETVSVIGDAQRGEIYTGQYVRNPQHNFERSGSIVIVDAESWCRQRMSGDVVTGPDVDRFERLLPKDCRILQAEYRFPKAETIARIGETQAAAGRVDDLWTLEPLYLRKSAAEEKWESTFDGGRGGGRL